MEWDLEYKELVISIHFETTKAHLMLARGKINYFRLVRQGWWETFHHKLCGKILHNKQCRKPKILPVGMISATSIVGNILKKVQ